MPTYTINLDGKTIKLKGDKEPTEAETKIILMYQKKKEYQNLLQIKM